MPGVEDGCSGPDAGCNHGFETSPVEWPVTASDDDSIGPVHAGKRLPEASERNHACVFKRLGRVDQQQIEVPGQSRVLESVIEDENIDGGALFDPAPGGVSIAVDDDANARARLRQQKRLIPGFKRASEYPVLIRHLDNSRTFSLVPAAQDSHAQALIPQKTGDEGHARGLACPSNSQIADADDGSIQSV